jgi:hypothetical protein
MIDLIAAAGADNSLTKLALTGLVTGAVSVAVSLVLARLTFRFVKQPELEATLAAKERELNKTYQLKKLEIEDTVRAELDKERQRRHLDRAETVRREIITSAGPLLVSVEDLIARLKNILEDAGHGPLAANWTAARGQWTNTHDYFMGSTLYLFGRYFAWVQVLRDRLGADEYLPQPEKDQLLQRLQRVTTALSKFPAPYNVKGCPGRDTQVFAWQQIAMGEALIASRDGSVTVSSYADFVGRAPQVDRHFEPLQALMLDLAPSPKENCRWQRVTATRDALIGVRDECRGILDLVGPRRPAVDPPDD